MAGIERLVPTSELKTTRLGEARNRERHHLYSVRYHNTFDALIILFVSPENETVVHYIDDHVGLIYESETLEIVGLQVEAFEHSFLPSHPGVERVWRLSEAGIKLENFGDLTLAVERMKPDVAREVIEASKPALSRLGQHGKELAAALA
jgi:hypothetical protein